MCRIINVDVHELYNFMLTINIRYSYFKFVKSLFLIMTLLLWKWLLFTIILKKKKMC